MFLPNVFFFEMYLLSDVLRHLARAKKQRMLRWLWFTRNEIFIIFYSHVTKYSHILIPQIIPKKNHSCVTKISSFFYTGPTKYLSSSIEFIYRPYIFSGLYIFNDTKLNSLQKGACPVKWTPTQAQQKRIWHLDDWSSSQLDHTEEGEVPISGFNFVVAI